MNATILRTIAVALLIASIGSLALVVAYGTVPQFVMVAILALAIGSPLIAGFATAADAAEAAKA